MILRYVGSSIRAGAESMAIDVHLSEQAAKSGDMILRFYRWDVDTVSVGCSVKHQQAAAASIVYPGARLVRRPTGGGILFHGDQTSFSLSWPRNYRRMRALKDSYTSIHSCVQKALAQCGVPSRQVGPHESQPGLLCNVCPVAGDLLSESGAKIVGGAQWRSADSVLYQGHIWLPPAPALDHAIADCLANAYGLDLVEEPLSVPEIENARLNAYSWEFPVSQPS